MEKFKMKKIISILLIICTLTLCLASCGNDKDNDNTNQNTEQGSGEQNTNQDNNEKNDCSATGLHTYDKGECTGCGLKVFDVIKDYIIKNGEYKNNFYRITLGTLLETENTALIEYVPDTDCISITSCSEINSHNYSMTLKFTPYVFEDGEYEWKATCLERSCKHPNSIGGYLDPYKFSRSTTNISHNSNEANADELASNALKALKNNMNEYYIDFFKNIGNNITIKDLGFTRYN